MLLRLAEEERESRRGEQSEFPAIVLGAASHTRATPELISTRDTSLSRTDGQPRETACLDMAGPPSPLHQPLRSRLSSVPPPLSSADPILFSLPFSQRIYSKLQYNCSSLIVASKRTEQ